MYALYIEIQNSRDYDVDANAASYQIAFQAFIYLKSFEATVIWFDWTIQ